MPALRWTMIHSLLPSGTASMAACTVLNSSDGPTITERFVVIFEVSRGALMRSWLFLCAATMGKLEEERARLRKATAKTVFIPEVDIVVVVAVLTEFM